MPHFKTKMIGQILSHEGEELTIVNVSERPDGKVIVQTRLGEGAYEVFDSFPLSEITLWPEEGIALPDDCEPVPVEANDLEEMLRADLARQMTCPIEELITEIKDLSSADQCQVMKDRYQHETTNGKTNSQFCANRAYMKWFFANVEEMNNLIMAK